MNRSTREMIRARRHIAEVVISLRDMPGTQREAIYALDHLDEAIRDATGLTVSQAIDSAPLEDSPTGGDA